MLLYILYIYLHIGSEISNFGPFIKFILHPIDININKANTNVYDIECINKYIKWNNIKFTPKFL